MLKSFGCIGRLFSTTALERSLTSREPCRARPCGGARLPTWSPRMRGSPGFAIAALAFVALTVVAKGRRRRRRHRRRSPSRRSRLGRAPWSRRARAPSRGASSSARRRRRSPRSTPITAVFEDDFNRVELGPIGTRSSRAGRSAAGGSAVAALTTAASGYFEGCRPTPASSSTRSPRAPRRSQGRGLGRRRERRDEGHLRRRDELHRDPRRPQEHRALALTPQRARRRSPSSQGRSRQRRRAPAIDRRRPALPFQDRAQRREDARLVGEQRRLLRDARSRSARPDLATSTSPSTTGSAVLLRQPAHHAALMDTSEVERELEELVSRIERLRALYEQYFLDIEKLEPQIQRKDVDLTDHDPSPRADQEHRPPLQVPDARHTSTRCSSTGSE